jgi:hypothetical protein
VTNGRLAKGTLGTTRVRPHLPFAMGQPPSLHGMGLIGGTRVKSLMMKEARETEMHGGIHGPEQSGDKR